MQLEAARGTLVEENLFLLSPSRAVRDRVRVTCILIFKAGTRVARLLSNRKTDIAQKLLLHGIMLTFSPHRNTCQP